MDRHKSMCNEFFKRITAVIQELRIIQMEAEELFLSINMAEEDTDADITNNNKNDV